MNELSMVNLGKMLMLLGSVIALVGLLLTCAGHLPWLGRLPGDIYIQRDRFSFYFPLATSVLISVLVSLGLWFFRR